ncbi:hypothetical protein CK203_069010 [Vitis vinifera]|uniref:Uncharacterized protein n=1 Tax=Vitis vinifera TaxID=29760 RepID=A0A438F129_VITVI|nr:hypothetical protein CK203_069010 [Vitis vinifera]
MKEGEEESSDHILLHFQGRIIMEIGLLLIWSGMGVAFPNQSNTTKLAQLFHWKEERESLKCCISLFVLNYLEREIE